MKPMEREVLLSFWKVHILHHAGEAPVVGLWILRELREHGYEVSPGTLYPLLARLERHGWLKSRVDSKAGPRTRREYVLTPAGRLILKQLRRQITTLYQEVVLR